eukprot:CAMPEP_0198205958 /NCGR_PEP_ID=MMETSP1445-20131203/9484_1 /TAXON_ID=36898 /ORGANISM="Pyramimonas sp., Strain CCMP2087" /LENGTH=354 /DNA_ID=CAMNT_0043878455 /DNA_START=162 /DNA_END=1222 /DNA_ORIENTATION=+
MKEDGQLRDYFASVRDQGPREYADAWIDYHHFEELLARCAEPEKAKSEVRAQFFRELTAFVQTFFSHHEMHKKHILKTKNGSFLRRTVNRSLKKMSSWTFVDLDDVVRRSEDGRLQRAEVSREAFWCRAYAETHARAVKELLNEYDYHTGTKAGRDFLVAIQSIGRQADALMEHSTFMMELRALETLSERKGRTSQDDTTCDFDKASSHACPSKQTNTWFKCFSKSGDSQMDAPFPPPEVLPTWIIDTNDLQCAICLELLHNPVSLGCGHCFCTECALTEGRRATGNTGRTQVQKVGNVARCPLCRRSAVFEDAIKLDALDRYIQKKYPHQWAKQKQYLEDQKECSYRVRCGSA